MENYKELLSEYTKCTENVGEYIYGFGSGDKRYKGHHTTPYIDIKKTDSELLVGLEFNL